MDRFEIHNMQYNQVRHFFVSLFDDKIQINYEIRDNAIVWYDYMYYQHKQKCIIEMETMKQEDDKKENTIIIQQTKQQTKQFEMIDFFDGNTIQMFIHKLQHIYQDNINAKKQLPIKELINNTTIFEYESNHIIDYNEVIESIKQYVHRIKNCLQTINKKRDIHILDSSIIIPVIIYMK